MKNLLPKISVVIPSFNQGCFIEETILSILKQDYPSLELIIVDGKSVDNTIDVVNKYKDSINYFISEPDHGQANALNKGFNLSSGDICCYLNSDDVYLDNILWKIGYFYYENGFKWIFTNVKFGTSINKSHLFESRISSYEEFCAQQTIGQQGVFWENSSLNKPWFDENLSYVMDHKFFINLYKSFGRPKFLDTTGSFFRIHENSKTSRYEQILFNERRNIGLEAAKFANSRYQRKKITQEINRLGMKAETNHLFLKILSTEDFFKKIKLFAIMVKIFIKAPFKFRDLFFLGYLKKSLGFIFKY